MTDPSSNSGSKPFLEHLAHYRWPLALVAVVFLAIAGGLGLFWMSKQTLTQSIAEGREFLEVATESAQTIAERFRSGRITQTFQAAIPTISTPGMGNLEVATTQQVEVFRTEDERMILWDRINLGTTISEIRVPVTYRYHVPLEGDWHLDVSGQTCIVTAPDIRASLPPAIHTHRMEKWSEAGWARFNAREQLENLERKITPTLVRYARDQRHLDLVREQGRKTIAEFVQTWLLQEDHWRSDRFSAIKVVFVDETEDGSNNQWRPTLELEVGKLQTP